jgi:hypothetical protein
MVLSIFSADVSTKSDIDNKYLIFIASVEVEYPSAIFLLYSPIRSSDAISSGKTALFNEHISLGHTSPSSTLNSLQNLTAHGLGDPMNFPLACNGPQ